MSFLDPVLSWTLALPPLLSIFILSLFITLIVNLVYKFTTDQREMKHLKEQIERYRKEMKAHRDNPKKMQKMMQEANEVNLKYMGKSLKPTIYTFIPIIIIFTWMNAHFTYAPLAAGQPLTVDVHFVSGFSGMVTLESASLETKKLAANITQVDKDTLARFAVTGAVGEHPFTVHYTDFSYNGTVWFGAKPATQVFPGSGPVENIVVEYPRTHPLGPISLFGWQPGWLAVYITLSIILSVSTRKLMKIY